jgi:hypothetical protein
MAATRCGRVCLVPLLVCPAVQIDKVETATTERGPPCLSPGPPTSSGGTRSVASAIARQTATTARGPPDLLKRRVTLLKRRVALQTF